MLKKRKRRTRVFEDDGRVRKIMEWFEKNLPETRVTATGVTFNLKLSDSTIMISEQIGRTEIMISNMETLVSASPIVTLDVNPELKLNFRKMARAHHDRVKISDRKKNLEAGRELIDSIM